MKKMINLEKIRTCTRKIYEDSSSVKVLQEELEYMLSAIDKVNLEYNKGKISKEIFSIDEKKLKKESLSLIKKINKMVNNNLNCVKMIISEVSSQKIEEDINGNKKDKQR